MNNESSDSRFASAVCRVLEHGTGGLDQKVVARLLEAREEALRHQAAPVAVLSLAGIGQSLDHFVVEPLQGHYRAILALLAMVCGAVGVQFWQNQQIAEELAEIDSALLSDEVSPSAYLDQGFMEWLDHLSQQEEESLPQ